MVEILQQANRRECRVTAPSRLEFQRLNQLGRKLTERQVAVGSTIQRIFVGEIGEFFDFIAAAELRRQEFARLAAAVTPTLEALRSLTPGPFREQIALMMERLGHTIITDPTAPDLVTVKNGQKFITACAPPADTTPTGTRDLARLHQAVIAANAHSGIFVTARGFTADAREYAATAPIKLVDSEILKRSMHLSLKGVLSRLTYKAMCCQCGAIVQHRLSKGEALPCNKGSPDDLFKIAR